MCSALGSVPQDLTRGDGAFTVVPMSYPDYDARFSFAKARGLDDTQAAAFANQATGFRRRDMHEAIERGFDAAAVSARKKAMISARCGDVLEFIESPYGLDMSNAQPHVVRYLRGLHQVISANRKSPVIPNGLLFVGVPGNGKSHVARAFAHDCGMNMLRFKNLRNMWIGESERNLETVLDLLPSLAPSVVFIDEVDQMLGARNQGARDGAGETDARLLGRLLEFMGNSEHRGDIIWIGATNRPDLLDVAAVRRFDRVFPFMNPTAPARCALIDDLFRRLAIGRAGWSSADAAAMMDEFSCDDVEKVVRRAFEIRVNAGGASVELDDIAKARTAFKHNYDPVMHELIALLSIQASNFLSDLPWFDESGAVRQGTDLPAFVRDFVNDDGRINGRALGTRVQDLRRMLRSA
jgi:hypothetical protein